MAHLNVRETSVSTSRKFTASLMFCLSLRALAGAPSPTNKLRGAVIQHTLAPPAHRISFHYLPDLSVTAAEKGSIATTALGCTSPCPLLQYKYTTPEKAALDQEKANHCELTRKDRVVLAACIDVERISSRSQSPDSTGSLSRSPERLKAEPLAGWQSAQKAVSAGWFKTTFVWDRTA